MSPGNINNFKMKKIYIVGGLRTPFGSFGGALKHLSVIDLAYLPSEKLLQQLSIPRQSISHVIFANVIPSTPDCLYAGRHLGLKLRLPIEIPSYSVNRLCGSGIEAVIQATQQIQLNRSDAVLCVGSESMSQIPHLLYGARFGHKYGYFKTVDLLSEALTDKYCNMPMGLTAENLAEKYQISREEAESFSCNSHLKAIKANEIQAFRKEICSIGLEKFEVYRDENVRDNPTKEEMQKLKTSFKVNGTVTPATASGIVDGGAAVLIASEEYCEEHKLNPIAQIVDYCSIGVDPAIMGIGPVPAIRNVLFANSLEIDDIDLFEINEAFASQVVACKKELKIQDDKLNFWGGAIAFGHPLGASGIRIVNTLANQLKFYEKKLGIASACIGGGQGISLLIKNYE